MRLRKHISTFERFERKAGPRNWFIELFPSYFVFEVRAVRELFVLRVLHPFLHFSRKTWRYCR